MLINVCFYLLRPFLESYTYIHQQSLIDPKYRDNLRYLTYSEVDILPDISTTLSDAANGNFSFSIFVMRTSPSVCVDIHFCMWAEKVTWGGRN